MIPTLSSPSLPAWLRHSRAMFSVLAVLMLPLPLQAGPLHIEADSMLLQHANSQVEFSGKVRLSRDDFTLSCDRLIGHYRKDRHEIEKAEAFGHVTMRQGKARGQSERAVLDQRNQTLTLIGHAFIEQGGSRIEGERIVHHIDRQQTLVTPKDQGRTRMLLDTDETNGTGKP